MNLIDTDEFSARLRERSIRPASGHLLMARAQRCWGHGYMTAGLDVLTRKAALGRGGGSSTSMSGRTWPGSAWPARRGVMVVRPPEVNPLDREQVPAAGTYRAGEPVWVHRHGWWNPGIVREASPRAVLVDYHVAGQRASLTDTVMDLHVMRRDDPDPLLDTHPPHPGPVTPADQTASGGEQ